MELTEQEKQHFFVYWQEQKCQMREAVQWLIMLYFVSWNKIRRCRLI